MFQFAKLYFRADCKILELQQYFPGRGNKINTAWLDVIPEFLQFLDLSKYSFSWISYLTKIPTATGVTLLKNQSEHCYPDIIASNCRETGYWQK